MREGMVRNLVPPAQDFREEMRIFLGAFPDDEESRACLEAIEEVEDRDGVRWGRAIVDREPDFWFRGLK